MMGILLADLSPSYYAAYILLYFKLVSDYLSRGKGNICRKHTTVKKVHENNHGLLNFFS